MQIFLGFLALLGAVVSVPLASRDFFWFETGDGKVVPALLKDIGLSKAKGPIETDVTFWHYLPGDANGTQVTVEGEGLSRFIRGGKLLFAAHGFGDGHAGLGSRISNSFAQRGEEINIILINYSKRSSSPDYLGAVNNLPEVGAYAATLINYLVAEGYVALSETYVVGFSLGGHMANAIANNLEGGKLAKVFGLDPAAPLFDAMRDDQRLDPEDADYVQVIHTATGFLGMKSRRGHVDFYPNSGAHQPGCDDLWGSCSHGRAVSYWAESISSNGSFPSCKCESWEEYDGGECACEETTVLGWDTPETIEGEFFLRTNAASPYSQH